MKWKLKNIGVEGVPFFVISINKILLFQCAQPTEKHFRNGINKAWKRIFETEETRADCF